MKTKVFLLAAVMAIFAIGVMFSNGQQKQEAKVIDFTLKNLDGKEIKLSEFYKDKVLLLKFGATWCPPCKMEIPEMNKVVEAYKDKVAVVEVDIISWEFSRMKPEDRNVAKATEKVKEHARANNVKYTVVLDEDGKVAEQYGVKGIPYIVIAKGEKGVVLGGYKKFEILKATIDEVMGVEKKAEDKKPVEEKNPEAKK